MILFMYYFNMFVFKNIYVVRHQEHLSLNLFADMKGNFVVVFLARRRTKFVLRILIQTLLFPYQPTRIKILNLQGDKNKKKPPCQEI